MITYGNNALHTRGLRLGPRPLQFQEMIVLLLDLSPSMQNGFRLAGNRTMTRLDGLKEAATFVVSQKAAANRLVEVSIVGFGTEAKLVQDWAPLSRVDTVLRTIQALSLGQLGVSTNIADALEMGLDQIARFHTHPATRRQGKLQLVTDGKGRIHTEKYEALIVRARQDRVKVFTVGVSNLGDDECDPAFLFRLARETRGWHTMAQSVDHLKQALARGLAAAY